MDEHVVIVGAGPAAWRRPGRSAGPAMTCSWSGAQDRPNGPGLGAGAGPREPHRGARGDRHRAPV